MQIESTSSPFTIPRTGPTRSPRSGIRGRRSQPAAGRPRLEPTLRRRRQEGALGVAPQVRPHVPLVRKSRSRCRHRRSSRVAGRLNHGPRPGLQGHCPSERVDRGASRRPASPCQCPILGVPARTPIAPTANAEDASHERGHIARVINPVVIDRGPCGVVHEESIRDVPPLIGTCADRPGTAFPERSRSG